MNQLAVLKIGGSLIEDPAAMATFWSSVGTLRAQMPVVVVHGGGPQATELARRLGHEPEIVNGRRVTTDLDLQIMQWTVRGELNSRLAAMADRAGLTAVGLCGADGSWLRVTRRPPWPVDGRTVDFGWVGDVQEVRPAFLLALLATGATPILAPLGVDAAGFLYNVNADTVAAAVARALEASLFALITDSGGVRRDAGDPATVIPELEVAGFEKGAEEGWISRGMLVKLSVAFDARKAGIPDVWILAPDDLTTRTRGTRIR
jgi:acetylglutamate kinase